ncbi:MAG: hypothetical protein M1383_06470 [Patescibacteria group bacterium]|nr:hypothetical protein [Patescibacteria group bacterium]
MIKFSKPKNYALITGILLFCLGFFGFAFRTSFNLPGYYLFGSLILGFWGIIVGSGGKGNNNS